MQARADLHVHSKFSDRPSEWVLRRIGAPECFVEPEIVYARARERGMQYVTITDHNSIQGALAIAHLPNTFLSSELTTYFPEDGCKIHCLVFGITEPQFEELQEVRQSIYELRDYLQTHDILYTVAHPLFAVNDRLTLGHIERLLVLFNRFEALNGTRYGRANDLGRLVLETCAPELIADLATEHDIVPWGATPWRKLLTGGSDDHSGAYIASAHTVTPPADDVRAFLDHLRVGNHSPGGGAGTSIRLAQSFYNIAYSYYRDRFLDQGSGSGLLGAFLERVVSKRTAPGRGVSGTLRQVATRCLRPWRTSSLPGIEQQILAEITDLLRNGPSEPEEPDPDQANFGLACRISQQLSYTFLKNFSERVRAGSFLESLQTLASLGPVALSMAPYLTAFRTQHKDDPLLAQVSRRFKLPSPTPGRRERKAWITDTYTDINGVSRSIQKLGALAQSHGFDLTVVTCQAESPASQNLKLTCFPPVGRFRLPEYDTQELVFPPFMEILQYLEQGGFTELIVSTPGPLGLTALAAGRLLGLRLTGIYHTDFPQYVQCLTEDEALTGMTWRYMEWFYGRMDRVFAPSAWYRRELLKRGFAADAVQVLPRGVDTAVFHPGNRVEDYWTSHGCNGGFKFLYAGRVSREKNLETLFRAFNDYRNSDAPTADLIVVGDGPDLAEFRKRMQGDPGVVFTGFMDSSELARAYASADAFVFPSLSDTFGNVVLEAQASGLPAIVADVGGPPEIVVAGESGLQVDMRSATSLAAAMGELARDPARHESMRRNAVRNAAGSDWTRILELLWEDPGPAPATDRSRPCASA